MVLDFSKGLYLTLRIYLSQSKVSEMISLFCDVQKLQKVINLKPGCSMK